ncbi:hypothetical protein CBR_g38773 [Chara braunii]|uniref:RING-type E3 ubiquitin transferase n=1 Tax=Chara braunii TaxID=69332 RepID=A0A388LQ71_CHABU|nr:hypothetical protein CBR_g38773 [Chara braunii]|eukprot:GBG84490.1 hypothetical protein CBR_g38773 [Chara braunii]
MGGGRERVESVGYSQSTHSLRSSSASVDGGSQVPHAKRQKTRGGFSDLLTCPVCFETMFAPIYQCNKGHTVCCGCKAKVTSCPSCRGPLGDIRCLALEQAAELVDVPCRYQDHGCPMMVEYTAKKEHEETCKFRPFECISVGCQAEGTVPWLLTHLKAHPKISIYESAQITTNIVVSDKVGAYHPLVYSAHTQYFCLRMEMCKLMGPLVLAAWVQFMGESEMGRSFRIQRSWVDWTRITPTWLRVSTSSEFRGLGWTGHGGSLPLGPREHHRLATIMFHGRSKELNLLGSNLEKVIGIGFTTRCGAVSCETIIDRAMDGWLCCLQLYLQ